MEHVASSRELLLCTAGDAGAVGQGQSAYLEPGDVVTLTGPSTGWRVGEDQSVDSGIR